MGDSTDGLGKGRRTRSRILEGAERVFGLKGYDDATIVDITRASEVALGTFYVHFPSKRAIFEELVRERGRELRDTLREAAAGVTGRRFIEEAGLRAFFSWIAEHPGIYRVARRSSDGDAGLVHEWYEIFADAYTSALRRSMGRAELPPADPEVLAFAMMGMADFFAMRFIVWAGRPPLDAKIDAFIALALRALGLAPASVAAGP